MKVLLECLQMVHTINLGVVVCMKFAEEEFPRRHLYSPRLLYNTDRGTNQCTTHCIFFVLILLLNSIEQWSCKSHGSPHHSI